MGFTALDYEKLILGYIFSNPDNRKQMAYILAKLPPDSFDPQNPHLQIYRGFSICIDKNITPDILAVLSKMPQKGQTEVGGESYLKSLIVFYEESKVSERNLDLWLDVIIKAGRLRLLSKVIIGYSDLFKDFNRLVSQVEDVEAFINNIVTEVNRGMGEINTGYKHISESVRDVGIYLEKIKEGTNIDLIPCGLPGLEEFMIPRPYSFGVFSGLTSSGKTMLALLMSFGVAANLQARNEKGIVCINSLETVMSRLVIRLACLIARINSKLLAQGNLSQEDYARFEQALNYLNGLPIYYDDNPAISSDTYVWNALAIHLMYVRKMGFSDYTELFADKSEGNDEARVAKIARNGWQVAYQTGSCEAFVSQVNDSALKSSAKIGGVHSTRSSRGVGHAADWQIETWNGPVMRKQGLKARPPEGMSLDSFYALVVKNKEYPTGRVQFMWQLETGLFRDIHLSENELIRLTSDEVIIPSSSNSPFLSGYGSGSSGGEF